MLVGQAMTIGTVTQPPAGTTTEPVLGVKVVGPTGLHPGPPLIGLKP